MIVCLCKQVIETQRTQWQDIVRQYKDLFCRTGTGADTSGRSTSPELPDDVGHTASNAAALQLLHRWISGRIHWFLGQLSKSVRHHLSTGCMALYRFASRAIPVLCHVVLCCAVLCCAVLCCAVLCCAVLYCAWLQVSGDHH